MKNIKQCFYLLLLLAAAGCGDGNDDNPYIDLKLNFNVGDRFTLTTEKHTKSGGMISLNSYNVTKFKVDSAFDDAYRLKANIQQIRSEGGSGDIALSYDSQKPEAEMDVDEKEIHDQYKEALNNAVNVIINNNNEITKSVTYNNGARVPETVMDLTYFTLDYPKKKVKVGSTWQKEKTNSLTSGKMLFNYTIKEITKRNVIIGLSTSMDGIIDKIDGSGQYNVDTKSGRIKKADIHFNLSEGVKLDITMRVKVN